MANRDIKTEDATHPRFFLLHSEKIKNKIRANKKAEATIYASADDILQTTACKIRAPKSSEHTESRNLLQ